MAGCQVMVQPKTCEYEFFCQKLSNFRNLFVLVTLVNFLACHHRIRLE